MSTTPTPRQQAIYDLVCEYFDRHGTGPGLRYICAKTGLESTHTAAYHCDALVTCGLLVKTQGGRCAPTWAVGMRGELARLRAENAELRRGYADSIETRG